MELDRPDSPRRSVRSLAAGIGAVLAVALAAGLVAGGVYLRNAGLVAQLAAGGASPAPAGKVIPQTSQTDIVEIDFLDRKTGFALLCTHPGGGQCQYSVRGTKDGGATWSAPVKVGMQVTSGDSGHHVHFANPLDGVVYGNSSAYLTHDGGRTWTPLNMKFLEIVAVSGTAPMWMVLDPCAKGVLCGFQVLASADGGHSWKLASTLPAAFTPASVMAFGPAGLLVSTFGPADMMITRDGGASWARISGQCRADTLANRIATADGSEIWQLCTPMPPVPSNSTPPWSNAVFYTRDGGAHWTARQAPAGTFETIASFGSGRAIEATVSSGLRVTRDGGATWKAIANNPQSFGIVALSWTLDGHAWAADVSGVIWATRDYGKTWSRLAAQP